MCPERAAMLAAFAGSKGEAKILPGWSARRDTLKCCKWLDQTGYLVALSSNSIMHLVYMCFRWCLVSAEPCSTGPDLSYVGILKSDIQNIMLQLSLPSMEYTKATGTSNTVWASLAADSLMILPSGCCCQKGGGCGLLQEPGRADAVLPAAHRKNADLSCHRLQNLYR